MKKFYLTGHRTFSNRGCEAIVRSTVDLLRNQFGPIVVFVPSDDILRDNAQWPEASTFGVEFTPAYFPIQTRFWANFQRLPIPLLKRAGWPFFVPKPFKEVIQSVDAVLSVGGDNYSLDYRIPSLLMGIDDLAMKFEKPVILWGASVGPFEKEPSFLPLVREHLAKISLIAVRESASNSYLKGKLRLNNIISMSDPAFNLVPQKISLAHFWPKQKDNGILGINISPVIERYFSRDYDLRNETIKFIRSVVQNYNMSVLLVPHVMPLNGNKKNNDAFYMQPILYSLSDLGSSVSMMDISLNAPQIKYAISECRFFIGARTHSTIASLSSKIPTISIAYSVKAKGINEDIFGNQDALINSTEVNEKSLIDSLEWLFAHEQKIKDHLTLKLNDLTEKNVSAVERIDAIL